MTPERWQQIDQLFHAALACEPPQRDSFLANACAGDEQLRREVESLILFHHKAQTFIETPAADVAAELLGAPESTLAPGQQIGNYRIVRQLGSGGMGEVYLADDSRLNRKIALKLLPPEFTTNADRVRRFEREARAACALNHPNIVTIYEIGESDSAHFIATEFIDGKTLRELINEKPCTLNEALNVVIQVAGALTGAHRAGIVHRDIKPENIMVRADGYVKILDFGLAKLTETQTLDSDLETPTLLQSNPGLVMGTVQYMSPEQARGKKVDARTDIWSLGVVLYELLAGRVPFSGETPSHVMVSLMEDEPLALTSYTNVPTELNRVVIKALRKNKKERYQTARELAHDLKELKRELQLQGRLKQSVETDEDVRERATKSNEQMDVDQRYASAADFVNKLEEIQLSFNQDRSSSQLFSAVPIPERRAEAKLGPARNRAAVIAVAGSIGVLALVLMGWLILGTRNQSRLSVDSSQPGDSKPGKLPPPTSREPPCSAQSPTQGTGRERTLNLKDGVTLHLVEIPSGSFCRGSAAATGNINEQPQDRVTLGSSYMGEYEVTQAQWQAVMGNNPSGFKGDNLPVEKVSWDDAVAFMARLNAQNDGYTYRLPTEAEWEYACRAGSTGEYAGDPDATAWYGNNSGRAWLDAAGILRTERQNYVKRIEENGGQTHPVGSKLPNAFGLFDMNGNVWEWCQDWYHDNYNGAPTNSDAWLSGGDQKSRVLRGGSWNSAAVHLRSAHRDSRPPDFRSYGLGFRVVAVARTS